MDKIRINFLKMKSILSLAALFSASFGAVSAASTSNGIQQTLYTSGGTGNIYSTSIIAGSKKIKLPVTLDTAQEWTVIQTATREVFSPYYKDSSTTAEEVFKDPKEKTRPVKHNFASEGMKVHGVEYIEDIRLTADAEPARFNLVVVEELSTEKVTAGAGGLIGLAPEGGKSNSFVESMYQSGQIKEKVVGFNYDDPSKADARSVVTWGGLDSRQIVNGTDGLFAIKNSGTHFWQVIINSISYGGDEFTGQSSFGLIYTSDTFITVGSVVFDALYSKLKQEDPTIFKETKNGMTLLKSCFPCHIFKYRIQELKFVIGDAELTIQPDGFIFPDPEADYDCVVAIRKLEETTSDLVQLGTFFLRNFYFGLDFGKNEVLFGGKAGSDTSSFLIKNKKKHQWNGSGADTTTPAEGQPTEIVVPSKDELNVEWCKEHPANSWLGAIILASRRGAPLIDMWACQVWADNSVIWTIVSPWKDWKLIVGS